MKRLTDKAASNQCASLGAWHECSSFRHVSVACRWGLPHKQSERRVYIAFVVDFCAPSLSSTHPEVAQAAASCKCEATLHLGRFRGGFGSFKGLGA